MSEATLSALITGSLALIAVVTSNLVTRKSNKVVGWDTLQTQFQRQYTNLENQLKAALERIETLEKNATKKDREHDIETDWMEQSMNVLEEENLTLRQGVLSGAVPPLPNRPARPLRPVFT